MTRFLALLAAMACVFATPVLAQNPQLGPDPAARDTVIEYGGPDAVIIETANGPVTITAEIADTAESRQRGLMWREELAPGAGMLFDFEISRPVSIWMRNTLIPLDIIYIRADGTVAKIIAHAQPLSRRQLLSDVPVLSVLELADGQASALGIAPGDVVRHAIFGNVEVAEPEMTPEAPVAEPVEEPATLPEQR